MIINLGLDSSGPSFKLQNKTVSPGLSTIEVTYDANYEGLKSVKVRGVDASIDADITSGNIKEGVSILGVSGEYAPLLENVIATPRTTSQVITPSAGYDAINNLTINAVTADIDSNIKPENIRIGKSILSVVGNYDIKPDAFVSSWSLSEINIKNIFSIVDLRDVDMSNISDMNQCFALYSSLQSVTLPSSMPAVTNMNQCFALCSSLQSITLPSDMTAVTDMNSCFVACTSLQSITLPRSLTAVTDIFGCFIQCTSLENIDGLEVLPDIDLTNWGIDTCNLLDTNSLNRLIATLPTTTNSYTCTLGTTNLSKLTAEEIAVATNKGWTLN